MTSASERTVIPTMASAETVVMTRRTRRAFPVKGTVAAVVIVAAILASVLAPLLTPNSPVSGTIGDRLLPVGSPGHLFGTDGQGRDILTRLLFGGRLSLVSGLIPVVAAGVLGTAFGILAGLVGPRTGAIIMRSLDVLYAFPAVLLAIAIAASLGPGVTNAIVALSVVLIPSVARVTETEVRRLRSADFMDAARASGASLPRIAIVQVLPNVLPAVIVYCTALVGLSLVFAAGLSFLGLGIAPPAAEWGAMVGELQAFLFTQPTLLLAPAIAILLVSVAFNVLGDALRKFLDVRGAE